MDKNLSNILLYADDTILYTSSEDMSVAIQNNQRVLNIVSEWCNINRLSININRLNI